MSAHAGCAAIYATIVDGLKPDARLEVDAILGDPDAVALQHSARWSALELLDVEVG